MTDRFMAVFAPNFSTTPTATVVNPYTAGTVVAAMPLANLLTDEPSDRSRLLTHDPFDTYWQIRYGDGTVSGAAPRVVAGLALVNVNLSRFGKYRFVGMQSPVNLATSPFFQRLAPTTQLATVNAPSALASVDESPRSPDGLWLSPLAVGSDWSVRYGFDTPLEVPATGKDKNAFVLWARRTGSLTAFHPIINVRLYEAGTLKSDLGNRVVSSTTGQILIFRWDASLLTTASGANAEIFIEGRCELETNMTAELGAVAWDSEQSAPGTFGYLPWDHDSGWLDSPFDAISASWGGTAADEATGPEPTRNLDYEPLTAWKGLDGVSGIREWIVMFSDDQADNSYTGTTGKAPASRIRPPDGYAQAGVAVSAPIFTPSEVNFGRGPLVAARDPSSSGVTLGGQEFGSRRRPRRVMPVTLPQLTEQEGYDLFDRIDWRRGKKLPVLVVRFPDGSAINRRHTTLWATLEDMPGLVMPPALGKLAWSGVFVEKL